MFLLLGSSTAYVIDRSSTSQEVFDWLHSLGFSDSTVSCMGVLSGAQVFAMTRDEIKEVGLADVTRSRHNFRLSMTLKTHLV